MLVLFLGRFWRTIASTEYLILATAFVFMGMSLLFDQIDEGFGDNVPSVLILLEDGAKFLGIVTWLVYFTRTCLGRVTTLFARERLKLYVRPTEPRA